MDFHAIQAYPYSIDCPSSVSLTIAMNSDKP